MEIGGGVAKQNRAANATTPHQDPTLFACSRDLFAGCLCRDGSHPPTVNDRPRNNKQQPTRHPPYIFPPARNGPRCRSRSSLLSAARLSQESRQPVPPKVVSHIVGQTQELNRQSSSFLSLSVSHTSCTACGACDPSCDIVACELLSGPSCAGVGLFSHGSLVKVGGSPHSARPLHTHTHGTRSHSSSSFAVRRRPFPRPLVRPQSPILRFFFPPTSPPTATTATSTCVI
ncbi:hypothetical protein BDZ88DRAFT_216270 [Geranomyces variabilis]|nr:hypothetical protein BDZ88DRAFT_216270 [Geranomyces variabilis]